jgi:hypothetical protein
MIGIGKYRRKAKISRPGVQAKTKQSKNKNSKNYVKRNIGQGK